MRKWMVLINVTAEFSVLRYLQLLNTNLFFTRRFSSLFYVERYVDIRIGRVQPRGFTS